MPLTYLHARLKFCDDKFTSGLQYIYQALDWIEWYATVSTVYFTERKKFQTDVTVCCLQNQDNVMGVITNDQILASFKEIWWTPQYFDNMLYVLAKLKQYDVYTFFLTFSRDEFEWPYIIQANHSIFMHLFMLKIHKNWWWWWWWWWWW